MLRIYLVEPGMLDARHGVTTPGALKGPGLAVRAMQDMADVAEALERHQVRAERIHCAAQNGASQTALILGHKVLSPRVDPTIEQALDDRAEGESGDAFEDRIRFFLGTFLAAHTHGVFVFVASPEVVRELHGQWYGRGAKLIPFSVEVENVFTLQGQ